MCGFPNICGDKPLVSLKSDRSCNCQCTSNCCCFPFFRKKQHEVDCNSKVDEVAQETFQEMNLSANDIEHQHHRKRKHKHCHGKAPCDID